MAFDPFKGYVADPANPPSVYDVQRRQKLAESLQSLNTQNQGPLGALAQVLASTGAGYNNQYAAQEAQSGLTGANQKLAQILNNPDASSGDLITSAGDPFIPDNESGLVGDLIKRKLGIGETFYGTPQVSFTQGPNGEQIPHYTIIGSLGTVKEIKPPVGAGDTFSIKNQLVDTPTAAGVAINPYSAAQVSSGVTKDNSQAEFDKKWGETLGADWATAPQQLQKEGNLVQQQTASHQMVSNKIDQAVKTLDDNPTWMAGTVGAIVNAVPGTPQYDLAQQLETIKANIGFDQLQNMKDNSATGSSGLGQISNMEEQLLQAINGSLQQGQSAQQLKANLLDIKQRIAQIIEQKKQAVIQDIQRYKSGPAIAPTLGGGATTNLPNVTAPAPSGSKTINGVTYTQDANGDWYAN